MFILGAGNEQFINLEKIRGLCVERFLDWDRYNVQALIGDEKNSLGCYETNEDARLAILTVYKAFINGEKVCFMPPDKKAWDDLNKKLKARDELFDKKCKETKPQTWEDYERIWNEVHEEIP